MGELSYNAPYTTNELRQFYSEICDEALSDLRKLLIEFSKTLDDMRTVSTDEDRQPIINAESIVKDVYKTIVTSNAAVGLELDPHIHPYLNMRLSFESELSEDNKED